ncbi:D-Ala-D-Ala carboxypeptidase family metallohydrolase, partial [Sedimenticola sp.]|uniref:D-Ala-D-Ala carboxypeptidase family metallohydrolase n=1 Tax=Sedimenticola sp. TaxID=1940285 RepID=UPI003D10E1C4
LGVGAGDGPLRYRPAKYVPIQVPIFDEASTRQLRDEAKYRRQAGEEVDPVAAVYEWPYRPEMQFSVFDLTVNEINRTDGEGNSDNLLDDEVPVLGSGDDSLQVIYDLLGEPSGLDPLERFGGDRELVLVLGEDEVIATIGPDGEIVYTNLEHLGQMDEVDYLTLRLYQNDDTENVLWEFAYGNGLNVISSANEQSNAHKSFVMRNTEDSIKLEWLPDLKAGDQVQWKIEALSGLKEPNVRDDLGTLTNAALKQTMYGKVQVQDYWVLNAGHSGTGENGSPWVTEIKQVASTSQQQQLAEIRFRPDMSGQPHPQWQTSEDGDSRHKGTGMIDVWHRNPRVGYTVTFYLNGVEKASATIRMDEIDLIRQEYINHNQSANTSISIPERGEVVALSTLPVGQWAATGYPYHYVLERGMMGLYNNLSGHFGTYRQTEFTKLDQTTVAVPNNRLEVSSAYRNPERNERVGGTKESRHMLGRAIDFDFQALPVLDEGASLLQQLQQYTGRGILFGQLWQMLREHHHDWVPTANFAQLEGRGGPSDVQIASTLCPDSGVCPQNQVPIGIRDQDEDEVADEYELTFHLHIQDNP